MSSSDARDLIMMGLEVDSDSDADGTLASQPILDMIADNLDASTGLLEVLASLARAAEGAADIHEGMSTDETTPDRDINYADVCARLKRFAALIDAARKEIA